MHPETLAVHAGRAAENDAGAVAPPLVLSTTFEREPDGTLPHGYSYSRSANPNRTALESALKELEGGAEAAAFPSGSAAIMAALHALSPGDHLIAPRDIYYGTRVLIETLYGRWGLQASFVEMTDVAEVRAAVQRNTRLLWAETPSNPRLRISDIAALAEVAHTAGARLAVDNTWATPILQQPLALGADLVMHSTTKYFGGHSDVTGGALIAAASDEFFQRVRQFQTYGGAAPSPFDCWLILRNIPNLPQRMRTQSENAQRVAEFLGRHPKIAAVHYPGLPDDLGHVVAARQMKMFGGMLAMEVRGGRAEAFAVLSRVKVFRRATSLGGPESLIEHRASVEGEHTVAPESLLRLSIGLEHADDLIADLDQALGL
jgi:cystathionine gamma-synthase